MNIVWKTYFWFIPTNSLRLIVFIWSLIGWQNLQAQGTTIILRNVKTGSEESAAKLFKNEPQVVIFSSLDCPFDEHYMDRINQMSSSFPSVPLLIVFSETEASQRIGEIRDKVKNLNPTVSAYIDIGAELKQKFSVRKSMHTFFFTWQGGNAKYLYNGAFDDNPQNGGGVKQAFLANAIENYLDSGSVDVKESRVMGCVIR